MKRTASVLVCLFLAVLLLPLLALPAQASHPTSTYGDWEYQTDEEYGGIMLIKYNGTDSVVTIPERFAEKYVEITMIGSGTFTDNLTITKVDIPESVKCIGMHAFQRCKNLREVTGGVNLEVIDDFAFAECESLESFELPASIKTIHEYVFFKCYSLEQLSIPSDVTTIEFCALYFCDSLSVVFYGGSFYEWGLITVSPNGNDVLSTATIRYSGIPISASGACGAEGTNLTWVLEDGDKCRLTISGTGDMANYSSGETPWYFAHAVIEEVVIEDGVTGIGADAFDQFYEVTTVTVPSTVKRIGAYAFCHCHNLEAITIPAGVKAIPKGTFQNCWALKNVILPAGVTSIGESAFDYCSELVSVTIPDSVKSIGAYAFSYCFDLTGLTIPEGVTVIEDETIKCGYGLEEVVIPGTVQSIGDCAFDKCDGLKDVWFGGTSAQWTALLGGTTVYVNEPLFNESLTIHYKPAIEMQPLNVNTTAGSNVQFTVSAIGDGLSYQWQVCEAGKTAWKDSPATGNKTAILTIPATASRDGYQYRCIIKNKAGKTTSNPATLTVTGVKPKIAAHPSNVTAAAGSGSTTFKVTATGSGLSYQWQYLAPGGSWKNSPATGNKTATLTVPATADRNGYKYRCIVTNSGGSVTSNAATLTVTGGKPTITTQPSNVTAAAGSGNATFKVAASGSGLSYQWQVSTNGGTTWSNSPATGNKTATLSVPVTADRNGYKYRCNVTNSGGTTTSSAATLTVTGGKPVISTQPANAQAKAGTNVTFKVVATGSGLTYQWQVCEAGKTTWKDSPATGNQTATLTVPATASRNGYKYRCIVKNSGGTTTSSAATLTVLAITTQPKDKLVSAGGSTTFTVAATGTGLTYQWQVSTNGGSSWSDSPADGNKTAALTIPVTSSRNGYKYRCIVKMGSLSVTSTAATLTVVG